MNKIFFLAGGASLVLLGLLLTTVESDRLGINVQPDETPTQVVLAADRPYTQEFVAPGPNISRLGVWLRSMRNLPADAAVTVQVRRADATLASASIPGAFIESDSFSVAEFIPPVPTVKGDTLTFSVSVPTSLTGALALRQGEAALAAHQVYYLSHPAFALVAAALLVAAGVALWLSQPSTRSLVLPWLLLSVAVTVSVPVLYAGQWPVTLFVASFTALVGTYAWLRDQHLSPAAALTGAACFGLSTYWTLQYIDGWPSLLVMAFVPLLLTLAGRLLHRPAAQTIARAAILLTAALYLLGLQGYLAIQQMYAHPRDVLLDTYQVASATKLLPSTALWGYYGSYLGFLATSLALLGLVCTARRHLSALMLLVVASLLTFVPAGTIPLLPLPTAVALVSLALAYFAALGLEWLRAFLQPSALTTIVVSTITLLIVLDLLYVSAATLEAAYL